MCEHLKYVYNQKSVGENVGVAYGSLLVPLSPDEPYFCHNPRFYVQIEIRWRYRTNLVHIGGVLCTYVSVADHAPLL